MSRAIARTTPALLGLYTPWMGDLLKAKRITSQATAWYRKTRLAFAEALATVRREIRRRQTSSISRSSPHDVE